MKYTVKFAPSARVDAQIALLVFAGALLLYAVTLAPDVLPGDPGEFQFAAWRFGLAHPTGYPLYLMLGGAWQHALAAFGASPAWSLNLFSALCGALTVALTYLLMLAALAAPPALRRGAALFTALLLATNLTFWSQSRIAEVYTLHALLLVSILFVACHITHRAAELLPIPSSSLVLLAFLLGLSLTHHAMTLLLIPACLLFLFAVDRAWWQRARRAWAAILLAGSLPLLLYAYIPLRSGPAASPWLHQRLGATTLTLYTHTWPAFLAYITGRSISVGFHDPATAWAALPAAGALWRDHFGWVGLILMACGLVFLYRSPQRPFLILTLTYAILQQFFNLFYAIGDIAVYYLPLYVIAALWTGFGAAGIALLFARPTRAAPSPAPRPALGVAFLALLCLLPASTIARTLPQMEQTATPSARATWDAILAAAPAPDAILVSNDRDEMTPLFYFQQVEGRGRGLTGLFPLIAPGADFADIGATLDAALTTGRPQPVYLIKAMPGLDVKVDLAPATPPLVAVTGLHTAPPQVPLNLPYGPLTLLGYDWQPQGDNVNLTLHWQVDAPLPGDLTTSVQLLDANGTKLTQDDRPPGGVYYPTSLWKPGEHLLDRHTLALPTVDAPRTLLIGMYGSADQQPLASPLTVPLRVP